MTHHAIAEAAYRATGHAVEWDAATDAQRDAVARTVGDIARNRHLGAEGHYELWAAMDGLLHGRLDKNLSWRELARGYQDRWSGFYTHVCEMLDAHAT